MPKYTKAERQYIKGIVHNYALQRWSDQDIVDYLHTEKKIDLTKSMISKIRNQVEQQAEEWYLELKQSRYLYLAHFKERIDTLYSVEKSLWEIANDKDNQVVDRRGALAEIHHTEKTLSALYDVSRYLSASQLTGVPESDNEPRGVTQGQCDCIPTGTITHSKCRSCFMVWCPTTLKQNWCPNPECWRGIKGADSQPYDERHEWVQCPTCETWFMTTEILAAHRCYIKESALYEIDPVTGKVKRDDIEAPEWVDTKPVSIPKEQPPKVEVLEIKHNENEYEGPKEGDIIGRPWTPAEAYRALKKSKAGNNNSVTTTSFLVIK